MKYILIISLLYNNFAFSQDNKVVGKYATENFTKVLDIKKNKKYVFTDRGITEIPKDINQSGKWKFKNDTLILSWKENIKQLIITNEFHSKSNFITYKIFDANGKRFKGFKIKLKDGSFAESNDSGIIRIDSQLILHRHYIIDSIKKVSFSNIQYQYKNEESEIESGYENYYIQLPWPHPVRITLSQYFVLKNKDLIALDYKFEETNEIFKRSTLKER
jgi:hypothetical protein